MLSAVDAGDARAAALPARRADQAARCARWPPRPGCRSPPRPSRRTSASWPAPARPRSWPATPGSTTARGRSSTATAACSPRHRGAHHFTVGQRKGLGVAAPEPLYVLATDAGSNRVVAGPRAELATTRGRAARRPAAPRRGRGRPRQAALPLARACRAAWPPSTAAAASSWSCSSRSTAPRPGRPPACCAATWSSAGARSPHLDSSCHGDDHRRDPRAVPLLLRAARPQAAAVVPAGPAGQRPLDAADQRRACTRSSRT